MIVSLDEPSQLESIRTVSELKIESVAVTHTDEEAKTVDSEILSVFE